VTWCGPFLPLDARMSANDYSICILDGGHFSFQVADPNVRFTSLALMQFLGIHCSYIH
jgi:hypothetical protein